MYHNHEYFLHEVFILSHLGAAGGVQMWQQLPFDVIVLASHGTP
jgi:hypothetical protein